VRRKSQEAGFEEVIMQSQKLRDKDLKLRKQTACPKAII
jgi:hypothetical protein